MPWASLSRITETCSMVDEYLVGRNDYKNRNYNLYPVQKKYFYRIGKQNRFNNGEGKAFNECKGHDSYYF